MFLLHYFSFAFNALILTFTWFYYIFEYSINYLIISIYFAKGNMDGHRWPGRNKGEKWYISIEEYKFSTFPPWVQGMAYFLTPSLAKRIYELSYSTPYLFTGKYSIFIYR